MCVDLASRSELDFTAMDEVESFVVGIAFGVVIVGFVSGVLVALIFAASLVRAGDAVMPDATSASRRNERMKTMLKSEYLVKLVVTYLERYIYYCFISVCPSCHANHGPRRNVMVHQPQCSQL